MEIGIQLTNWCRFTLTNSPAGSMDICTVMRAISVIPQIGIAEAERNNRRTVYQKSWSG
jgi:hypothetical protein